MGETRRADPEALVKCKCGHTGGSHNQGREKYRRNGSLWACLSDGCDCQIFETLEEWAERMAAECPHCGGTGRIPGGSTE